MSPRTEQVSIYLRYISGGVTKETFTAIVHYYFFSLAGPRDKQVVFAIRAKLGLTPQMDVRPYAYDYNRNITTKLAGFDFTNVTIDYDNFIVFFIKLKILTFRWLV